MRASLLLASLVVLAWSIPATGAEPKKLEPAHTWEGSVDDLTLQKLRPDNGAITDAKTFAKVWKEWGVKGKIPEINFDKHLALLATTRGSRLGLSATLNDGDLRALGFGTKDLRPGFRYVIIVVSREGVQSINGKKLK